MFYFRICHLISATLPENMMMSKVGRYYRGYEHILSNNTHNCEGHVNLVLHTVFKYTMYGFYASAERSACVSSTGQCKTQAVDLG